MTIRSDALFDPDGMKKEKKESAVLDPLDGWGDMARRNHMADRIIQPEDFRSGAV